jgi:hypothetical protein
MPSFNTSGLNEKFPTDMFWRRDAALAIVCGSLNLTQHNWLVLPRLSLVPA